MPTPTSDPYQDFTAWLQAKGSLKIETNGFTIFTSVTTLFFRKKSAFGGSFSKDGPAGNVDLLANQFTTLSNEFDSHPSLPLRLYYKDDGNNMVTITGFAILTAASPRRVAASASARVSNGASAHPPAPDADVGQQLQQLNATMQEALTVLRDIRDALPAAPPKPSNGKRRPSRRPPAGMA
jgi:hypothetical protein